ncbi:hypothetical protein KAR10_00430 [bacterium]|nr:hypothetical protein [bacterium]
MSISPLEKITLYGKLKQKKAVLRKLQELGCLHLNSLNSQAASTPLPGPTPQAKAALTFLLNSPGRRKQIKDPALFNAHQIELSTLALQKQILALSDEWDFLHSRIQMMKDWGDFSFPPAETLAPLKLWFYIVPLRELPQVAATTYVWQLIRKDNRFAYIIVIAADEPEGFPIERTHTGSKSPAELRQRLESIEFTLEDLNARRLCLTRWCFLFSKNLGHLEDQANCLAAAELTYDQDPFFALNAWAPADQMKKLHALARQKQLVLEVVPPADHENPPTQLRNPPSLAGGQDLVTFYTTPNYWLWDPSIVVFFSFTCFFALILSDAGYAAILGLLLLWLWPKMAGSPLGRRLRILFAALVGAALLWGFLVGSYFGISPHPDHILFRFKILDLHNFDVMMKLSILTGVGHLLIANLSNSWRWRHNLKSLAPLGWSLIFISGTLLWLSRNLPAAITHYKQIALSGLGLGGIMILFFTQVKGPLLKRILSGLKSFALLSSAFGDTLSYLRLFALGLASASLATTFNNLAGQVHGAIPGIGLLFALIILVLGHAINFVLALASGVIHGLRLNFIEFFRWSISEEGYPFKAFKIKET